MCQNWEHRNQQNVLGTSRPPSFWMLGRQHEGRKRFQSLVESLALLNQGNVLLHRRAEPKELAYFIERTTKA